LIRLNRIHVEVCPTSSRETGGWKSPGDYNWKEHPCVVMVQNGIPVSFNSDDPSVFNTSLSWQYRTVVSKMMLGKKVLLNSINDAIDAAFCSQDQKSLLHKLIKNFEAGHKNKFCKISFNDRVIENALVAKDSI
jgi:adenosine deaminase